MNKYDEFEDVIFITVLCLTTFYFGIKLYLVFIV